MSMIYIARATCTLTLDQNYKSVPGYKSINVQCVALNVHTRICVTGLDFDHILYD